jgi:hypothetical protein
MAATSALSPNAVKVILDGVVDVAVDQFSKSRPNLAMVSDNMLFKQKTHDGGTKTTEEIQGTGYWNEKSEEADSVGATAKLVNQNAVTMKTWSQTLNIPKEFFDDAKHSVVSKIVAKMARNGRMTQERQGFGLYRNATTTTYGDGDALLSDTHTLGSGETQDNLITGALSEANLDSLFQVLQAQKDQDGVLQGFMPYVLLVPPALYKTACEILDSELRSGTADNDMNMFSSKYGVSIKSTPFISAAEGGSDTAYYLLAQEHEIERDVREALNKSLIDWTYSSNHNYKYTARYRENVTVGSHIGTCGSTGAA